MGAKSKQRRSCLENLAKAAKVREAKRLLRLVAPPPSTSNAVVKRPSTRGALELQQSQLADYRRVRQSFDATSLPSCIILRPAKREPAPKHVATTINIAGHLLRKKQRNQNYASLLNPPKGLQGKGKKLAKLAKKRRIEFAKNSPWRSVNKIDTTPTFWNENEYNCEVKEEEDEIEIGLDDFISEPVIIETDTLLTNDNIQATSEVEKEEGSRCLICFHHDLDPLPLKGVLPNSKKIQTNPEQLEDDMRIIYLLKMIFQWSNTELRYLMKHSNGQSPREWIHLCQSCRLLIFEIQTLEDRMRDCRNKIRDKIMKTAGMSSSVPVTEETQMTRRIRSLVNQQVRSTRSNNAVFINGDRKAEEVRKLESEMRKNRSEAEYFEEELDDFDNDVESMPVENDISSEDNHSTVIDGNHEDSKSIMNGFEPIESPRFSPNPGDLDSEGINEIENCSKEIDYTKAKPFEDFYVCSYCPSDVSTAPNKMDTVEIFYHLIFHHDYPMKCPECKIFLPNDSRTLDAHWYQYHPGTFKRYFETQIKRDPPVIAQVNAKKCLSKNEECKTSILCGDCLKDEDKEVMFEDMKTYKIHQAMKHPEVARNSCPLCPLVFTEEEKNSEVNKTALEEHLKTVHNIDKKDFWRSYLCKFCGRGIQKGSTFAFSERLHMMSCHVNLMKSSFTCTARTCSKEFLSLKEFLQHVKSAPDDHLKITNTYTEHLCNVVKNSITCGLCVGEKMTFKCIYDINSFTNHLYDAHSLSFKWKSDLMDNIIKWKPCEIRIEEVTEFCSLFKEDERVVKKELSIVTGNSKPTRPPKYSCLTCPHLKKMDLDAFLIHLIFHWRRPNRCTICKAYLPFASEAIDEHWKQCHTDDITSNNAVRFEAVRSAGDHFRCEKCPEKFASFRDRNEHEQTSHGWRFDEAKSCSVCNECFPNTEEVRLHKAMDHPEIASVSCYYCEELFPAESLEGVQFLDCEALKLHILEKEDHPKDKPGSAFPILHLYPCDFCGKVIEDSTKGMSQLRGHIMRKHMNGTILEAFKTPYQCFICNVELRQANLWKHLSTKHAKNCICETCGEEMRPWSLPNHNLVKHDVLMQGYQRYGCSEEGCGFVTVYASSLTHHISVHHNKERKRPHKCSICEKAFFTLPNLREHEERHQNKETRPFQCEICGGSYAVRNDLYIHKRLSHLNQKFPSTNRNRTKAKTKANPLPDLPTSKEPVAEEISTVTVALS